MASILILGGGVGGLVFANELRRRLRREHRITLVERSARHAFAPSFLWVMTGDRTADQITRPVRDLLVTGVELVQAEAQAIDIPGRRVITDGRAFAYDYLVIALGAELAPEAIPGLADAAHTFYTLDGAMRLHEALQRFARGTVAVVVGGVPYKCPGAPHEGAMLIADVFRRRRLRDQAELHLFTPEPQPMPVAGPVLGQAVQQMLETKGVVFHPLHKLIAVNAERRELVFEGRDPVRYDLLVAIPPHRPPGLLRQAGVANEAGWVPVDRFTLATGREKVYALGDVTAIAIPGRWKADVPLALPKAGVFAHAQASVLARRIAGEINGTGAVGTFSGDGYCMLEAGEDVAGFAFGNFFAEPAPEVRLRRIGRTWHLGKVLFERWWLAPAGPRRETLRVALKLGGKAVGIPVPL